MSVEEKMDPRGDGEGDERRNNRREAHQVRGFAYISDHLCADSMDLRQFSIDNPNARNHGCFIDKNQ